MCVPYMQSTKLCGFLPRQDNLSLSLTFSSDMPRVFTPTDISLCTYGDKKLTFVAPIPGQSGTSQSSTALALMGENNNNNNFAWDE